MMIRVKICGITRLDDALLAEELGASAVGFVFYKKSPRYVYPEKAGEISKKLGPFTARVGVFVDEVPDAVRMIVETAHLTAVQLHGFENQDYIDLLKGLTVIKALPVGHDINPNVLSRYRVSTFLLDTYSANMYGGTGQTFDWSIASECKKYGRIIIAGGLNESNVIEAIKIAQPFGIDISSGIESGPGIKDHYKMRTLFKTLNKENS